LEVLPEPEACRALDPLPLVRRVESEARTKGLLKSPFKVVSTAFLSTLS
jgi:hypothetical protein